MTFNFTWLPFERLSTDELYQLLALRQRVFVVEQNRDGQMHSLLVNELDVSPAQLVRVRHFDGTPITARFITQAIMSHVQAKETAQ